MVSPVARVVSPVARGVPPVARVVSLVGGQVPLVGSIVTATALLVSALARLVSAEPLLVSVLRIQRGRAIRSRLEAGRGRVEQLAHGDGQIFHRVWLLHVPRSCEHI
jgi:hypothetical protein